MEIDVDRILAAETVLIAGPTASGKSELALDLAERLDAAGASPVVVNADSMQVYQTLRILTARPDTADEARAPHHLYGHVPPDQAYSAGRWLGEVSLLLAEFRKSGQVAIIAGGTGLYFKALTSGLAEIPPTPEPIRNALRQRLMESGPELMHEELARRDAQAASGIKAQDAQRIVRALEVLEATGQSLASWQSGQQNAVLQLQGLPRFVVMRDRERVYRRIEQRFDAMIDAGAIDEVRQLIELDLDPDLPAMKAIGVREFADVIAGRLPVAEAVALAKTRTRQYAKRQMTWMRNQMADWTRIER